MKPALPYNRGTRQRTIARHRQDLPSPDIMVRNLRQVYDLATSDEIRAGTAWYHLAKVEAERVTKGHPFGAAIVAAMSPQTSWGRNLDDVAELFAGNLTGTTQSEANLRKAIAIIGYASPGQVLGGRKVRSFWRNMDAPDRPGPVTVDRHAMAAAVLGQARPEHLRQAVVGKLLERSGVYQMVAAAYRGLARNLGLKPHQLQAIIWLTWRRINQIGWADYDPF